MDSAACIGCGACVAACKNASAMLFTAAKVSHLALLPQGQVEREARVVRMVDRHDAEGFGSCSNEAECEAVCPKEYFHQQHRADVPGVPEGSPGQRGVRLERGMRIAGPGSSIFPDSASHIPRTVALPGERDGGALRAAAAAHGADRGDVVTRRQPVKNDSSSTWMSPLAFGVGFPRLTVANGVAVAGFAPLAIHVQLIRRDQRGVVGGFLEDHIAWRR